MKKADPDTSLSLPAFLISLHPARNSLNGKYKKACNDLTPDLASTANPSGV